MWKLAALSLLIAIAVTGCAASPAQSPGSMDADAVREFHESNRITYDYGDNGLTTPEGRDDIPVAPESTDGSGSPQAASGGSTGSVVMDDLRALSEGIETTSFSGDGDDTFSVPRADAVHLFRFTHEGDRMFTLEGYDEDGASTGSLGNATSAPSGTMTDCLSHRLPTDVQVKAEGPWSVEVAPMDQTPRAENGGSYVGPQVLYIDEPSISKITFSHDGRLYFSAEAYGLTSRRTTTLAYGTGAIDSTHVLKDPHCLLVVESWDDTPWTVSWE